MAISGTGPFSMPQSRFCLGLSGLRRSFSSRRLDNRIRNQKCGPDAPCREFPTAPALGGFLSSCARNKVGWVSVWNDVTTWFKGARTGQGLNGTSGMNGVKLVTGAAAAVLLLSFVGPVPALADTIEAALVRAY